MWLGKYYNWNLRAIQLAYIYFSVSDLGTQMHSIMTLVLDPPLILKAQLVRNIKLLNFDFGSNVKIW